MLGKKQEAQTKISDEASPKLNSEEESQTNAAQLESIAAEEKVRIYQQQVALLRQKQQQFLEESKSREKQHAELVRKLREEQQAESKQKMSGLQKDNQEQMLKFALESYDLEKKGLQEEINLTLEDDQRHQEYGEQVKDSLAKQLEASQEEVEYLRKQLEEREEHLEDEKKRLLKQIQTARERVEKYKETGTVPKRTSLAELDPKAQKEMIQANAELAHLAGIFEEVKKQTTTKIAEMSREMYQLQQQLQEESNDNKFRQKTTVELPPGFILWFHANAFPRIFALSQEENVQVLYDPNEYAPNVYPELPDGVCVKVDEQSKQIALQANEQLEDQVERVVAAHELTEFEFWLHYFSHTHAIKARLADQAWKMADEARTRNMNPTLNTFIDLLSQGMLITKIGRRNTLKCVRLFLRQVEQITKKKKVVELVYRLTWYTAPSDDVWYKHPSIDEELAKQKNVRYMDMQDVYEVHVGKTKNFPPNSDPDLCFSIIGQKKTLDFIARAKYEREALVEGFEMILGELAPADQRKKRNKGFHLFGF